jgi:hypothetical protein
MNTISKITMVAVVGGLTSYVVVLIGNAYGFWLNAPGNAWAWLGWIPLLIGMRLVFWVLDRLAFVGRETDMPLTSCSWCQQMHDSSQRYCSHCGHQAHVSRIACQCQRCRAMHGPKDKR